jgi:peptidoglycan hydrolase-like protein with peptidoglycan-binding domain
MARGVSEWVPLVVLAGAIGLIIVGSQGQAKTAPAPTPSPAPTPTPTPTPTQPPLPTATPPAPAPATVPCTQQVLREGNTGSCVKTLQHDLNLLAAHVLDVNGNPVILGPFPLQEDGIFGPLTRQAVEGLQQAMGITVDGIVGPQTWATIQTLLTGIQQQAPPTPAQVTNIWSQIAPAAMDLAAFIAARVALLLFAA